MQGMRISDVDIINLLPLFMRGDEASNGLSVGVNQFAKDLIQYSPLLKKWDQIDFMDDRQLDEMAWELNVLWYDTWASLETKRRLIKNSDMVYKRLGTKWAVEEIAAAYFGDDAQVLEWFDYGGRPHYFKVVYSNPYGCLDNEQRFFNALNIVKRTSSWLESITRTAAGMATLFASGAAYSRATHEATLEHKSTRAHTARLGVVGISHIHTTTNIGGVQNYG